MVKIPHQPPVMPAPVNPSQRVQKVRPVERVNKESPSIPETEAPLVERRKSHNDRRKGRPQDRGLYEMRRGNGDRRRNRRGPSVPPVDIDA